MKKIVFIGMLAFAAAFAFSSCKIVQEEDIVALEKAVADGNCEEAAKIAAEKLKDARGGTEDQKSRLVMCVFKCPEIADAMQ